MTDSTAKTPRDNLDDFDNDLDAVLNDAALSLDGINALPDDEDAIDRLLMDDSFDTADESTQSVGIKEKLVDDITLPEFDEFTGFDDVVDDFEQSKIIQYEGDINETPIEIDSFALFEMDQAEASNAALLGDNLAEIDDLDEIDEFAHDIGGQAALDVESVTEAKEPEQAAMKTTALSDELDDDFLLANFDITADSEPDLEQDYLADALGVAANVLANDGFDQGEQAHATSFEPNLNDTAGKIKQEPRVSSESVVDSAGMAAINQFKSDQDVINRQQKKLMQELDNKTRKATIFMVAALALASVSLIAAISVGVLAYGAKTETTKLTEFVASLEQEVKTIATTNSGNDINNVNLAVEQLNQKVDGLAGQLDVLGKSSEDLSTHKLTDVVSRQNVVNKTIAALQHKVDVLEKKKTTEAPVKPATETPVSVKAEIAKPVAAKVAMVKKKMKKTPPATTADWSVNLLALREQGVANSKAAEFAKKGVPVEVVQVAVNKQTWYRLRVSGFNNENEASAYAGRAKKALNLNSVWVTKK